MRYSPSVSERGSAQPGCLAIISASREQLGNLATAAELFHVITQPHHQPYTICVWSMVLLLRICADSFDDPDGCWEWKICTVFSPRSLLRPAPEVNNWHLYCSALFTLEIKRNRDPGFTSV